MNIEAQIYLADQRGCSQTDDFRSFHTFNFGNYFQESRESFGDLQAFNDDTLSPEHSVNIQFQENSTVVIIPLIGGLEYHNFFENNFLESGNALLLTDGTGSSYEIINPYEEEYINFVQIWLKNNTENFTSKSEVFSFDLNVQNTLHSIFSVNDKKGFIGKYEARKKGEFTIQNPEKGVFAFVVDGVFEVQDRLLHARDGLAISGLEMIDFEALSDGGIISLIFV